MPVLEQSARSKLTPPALAKQYGVYVGKVLSWIRSGELRAINAAKNPRGKPRFLIDKADVLAFEQSRAVVPPDPQRRRSAHGAKESF